jgi:hypothetical protein
MRAAQLHGRLGRIAQLQRDAPAALDHYKRAVHFAETVERPALLEQAVLHLATAQHAVNDPSAGSTYRRALGLAQQHGDVRREALVRLNLGILLTSEGNTKEGLNHLYRAADLAADLGPQADDLAERIEHTIDVAGGSTTSLNGSHLDTGNRPASRDDVVARDNERRLEDELYAETTLPPQ